MSDIAALQARFGRPLRLAVIGGGPSTWIGPMHRDAAEMDGCWRVVAGVLSSDPARSRAAGEKLGFEASRSYASVEAMLAAERARGDGVDAVSIMTPNDTHYAYSHAALDAGFDVICDKPVTLTHAEALDLVARTRGAGRVFAITHGYSAYPMVRYARRLVRDGALGAVRLVQVEYLQPSHAGRTEDHELSSKLRWQFDPERSGPALVLAMIGCHAQHLACSVAGAPVARVCADLTSLVPGRRVVDHASALIELASGGMPGARGTFTATQAAAGSENDIRLRVVGEKGMVEWSHREASYLRLALDGEPLRIVGRGDKYLPAEILALGRTPRGHPEGLLEAFANLYREVAGAVLARELGVEPGPAEFPRVEDGAHTMAFIEAAIASHRERRWVDVAAG